MASPNQSHRLVHQKTTHLHSPYNDKWGIINKDSLSVATSAHACKASMLLEWPCVEELTFVARQRMTNTSPCLSVFKLVWYCYIKLKRTIQSKSRTNLRRLPQPRTKRPHISCVSWNVFFQSISSSLRSQSLYHFVWEALGFSLFVAMRFLYLKLLGFFVFWKDLVKDSTLAVSTLSIFFLNLIFTVFNVQCNNPTESKGATFAMIFV